MPRTRQSRRQNRQRPSNTKKSSGNDKDDDSSEIKPIVRSNDDKKRDMDEAKTRKIRSLSPKSKGDNSQANSLSNNSISSVTDTASQNPLSSQGNDEDDDDTQQHIESASKISHDKAATKETTGITTTSLRLSNEQREHRFPRRRRHSDPVLPKTNVVSNPADEPERDWSNLDISKVLDASFLKRANGKKDLLARFCHLLHILQTECEEEGDDGDNEHDPREKWPGMGGLAWYVLETHLQDLKDSTIRLWAAAVCVELLAIFAPQVPWEYAQLKIVWVQVLHQIATLSSTNSDKDANLKLLSRILHLLAHIQMGALLVEIANVEKENEYGDETRRSSKASSSGNGRVSSGQRRSSPRSTKTIATVTAAVTGEELLAQFVSTLLQVIRAGASFHDDIVQAVSAVLNEYSDDDQNVPVAVLDELLMALLPGPTLRVPKYSTTKHGAPPSWHTLDNPVFRTTAAVLQANAATLHKPLSSLVHHLLAKAYHGVGPQDSSLESTIGTEPPTKSDAENTNTPSDSSIYTIVPLLYHISASQSSPSFAATDHLLLETRVMGMLQEGLTHLHADTREATCLTVAQCLTGSRQLDSLLLTPWLARHKDAVPDIRKMVSKHAPLLLYQQSKSQHAYNEETVNKLVDTIETLLSEPHQPVRAEALRSLCNDYLYPHATDHGFYAANRATVNRLLRILLDLELPLAEQSDVLAGLARVWARAAWGPLANVFSSSSDSADDRNNEEDPALFASLLMQQLDSSGAPSPTGNRKSNPNEEPSFVDWLISRLFQTATQHYSPPSSHSRPHQRTSSNSSQPKNRSGPINLMRRLESVLDQTWNKRVQPLPSRVQRAAAIVLWHRLSFQLGAAWGNPRTRRQQELSYYLEARKEAQDAPKDTEEALAADAKAMQILQRLSWWMSSSSDDDDEKKNEVLIEFHNCRDKQIFRILSTIANPTHSSSARQRAGEQVRSRCKAFTSGEAVANFAVDLVEQTAMPDFMNFAVLKDVIEMTVQYPQLRSITLELVHTVTHCFPKMAGPAWDPLLRLLQEKRQHGKKQRSAGRKADSENENSNNRDDEINDDQMNLITAILAIAAPTASPASSPPTRLIDLCQSGTPEQARNSVKTLVGLFAQQQRSQDDIDDDSPHSPLSLMDTLSSELSSSKTCLPLTILASLTALVESAPENIGLMESASHDAWAFCMKAMSKEVADLTTNRKRKSSPSSASPKADTQSIVCASIEFVVVFLRSFLLSCTSERRKIFVQARQSDVRQIFARLVSLMQPTKAPDEIRECAAVNFCRLCDSRLQLEPEFVTCAWWHAFARVFLEEQSSVQEALVQEFRHFLTGGGVYGDEASPRPPNAPSLRIASLFMFAQTKNIKAAATRCISILRDTCDKAYSQCMALGSQAEERYEQVYKLKLMPEYMVPYAFHLLAANTDENDDRTLRKRLKFLLEPLVHSLGGDADNVSFLLRMAEHLGNYKAVNPEKGRASDGSTGSNLLFISQISREVLLSLVKKDVNLSPYPGQIRIPRKLFELLKQNGLSQSSAETGKESWTTRSSIVEKPDSKVLPKPSSLKKSLSTTPSTARNKSHVQFSPEPEILYQSGREIQPPSESKEGSASFGDLSPISKPTSPKERNRRSSSASDSPSTKSPRGAPLHSQGPDLEKDTEKSEGTTALVSETMKRKKAKEMPTSSFSSQETSAPAVENFARRRSPRNFVKQGKDENSIQENVPHGVPVQINLDRNSSTASSSKESSNRKREEREEDSSGKENNQNIKFSGNASKRRKQIKSETTRHQTGKGRHKNARS